MTQAVKQPRLGRAHFESPLCLALSELVGAALSGASSVFRPGNSVPVGGRVVSVVHFARKSESANSYTCHAVSLDVLKGPTAAVFPNILKSLELQEFEGTL